MDERDKLYEELAQVIQKQAEEILLLKKALGHPTPRDYKNVFESQRNLIAEQLRNELNMVQAELMTLRVKVNQLEEKPKHYYTYTTNTWDTSGGGYYKP